MERSMVKADITLAMEASMKEDMKMILNVEKADINSQVEINMKETLKTM